MQQTNLILFKKLTNKLQNFSPVNDTFDATGQTECGAHTFFAANMKLVVC